MEVKQRYHPVTLLVHQLFVSEAERSEVHKTGQLKWDTVMESNLSFYWNKLINKLTELERDALWCCIWVQGWALGTSVNWPFLSTPKPSASNTIQHLPFWFQPMALMKCILFSFFIFLNLLCQWRRLIQYAANSSVPPDSVVQKKEVRETYRPSKVLLSTCGTENPEKKQELDLLKVSQRVSIGMRAGSQAHYFL